jgi:hypothetical protein
MTRTATARPPSARAPARTTTPPAPEAPAATPQAPPEAAAPPPSFRLAESATVLASPAEAEQMARVHQSLPHSPTERELDPKRVGYLVDRIKAGLLLPCCWATVLYRGTKYRMNGQHSSEALLEAAQYLPDQVSVHLDHYEVDSPEQMGVLFRQFDARWSGRSKADIAGAYQGLVEGLQHLSRRKVKLGIEGIAWYRRSVERLPVLSGDDLYQDLMVQAYHPFLRWLDKVLSIKTPELERAPIIGAAYATFVVSEAGAQDFWPHVAKSDLSDDSDPRSVLSAELVAVREGKGKSDGLAPGEFYAKCVKAWNAFRLGEKIRSLNVNTKKGLPEVAR